MNSDSSTVKRLKPHHLLLLIFCLYIADFILLLAGGIFCISKILFIIALILFPVCTALGIIWVFRYRASIKSFSESSDIYTNIQNMVSQEIKWQENKRQAHYLALQNQINPHFLYNTLEAIRSEALKAGLNTVADMSESLANYFRYTISQTSDFVTLAEEIQNVRDYFSIQKFRFGERLSLDIQIPETDDFQMYHMPKLILQPIVENSLIHGLESKLSGGLIKITAMFSDKCLYIYIEDNGVGITSDSLIELNRRLASDEDPGEDGEKHGGIAIKNVNSRIRLIYGDDYGLTYFSLPQVGTTVEISLPAQYGK